MSIKPTIIYGGGKIAEVIAYCMSQDPAREIAAFTVDEAFIDTAHAQGDLPIVAFENVEEHYPPSEFDMFIALGYQDLNNLRAERFKQAKAKGYDLPSCLPSGGRDLGFSCGENCFVMDGALIHPCASIGDNVFVWSGALVGHHSKIGDNCWVTSCANIAGVVTAGRNCFFAVNATVAHGVKLGDECFVGANTLVSKCCEDGAAFITQSTEQIRLNSRQFLRMSGFDSI